MIATRPRTRGTQLVAIVAVLLSACTPSAATTSPTTPAPTSAPRESSPLAPTPLPSAPAPSPSVSATPTPTPTETPLFSGQTLAYAQDGFTSLEVAKIAGRLNAPVTVGFSTESELVANQPAVVIPVALLFTDATAYARAVGRPVLAANLLNGIVLATAEARLRTAAVGDVLEFSGGKVRLPVTAIVDDHVIGGFEMATGNSLLRPAAAQPASYLLIGGSLPLAQVRRAVGAELPTRAVRVETDPANGYFSGASAVLPQLRVKLLFGEFTIRRLPGGAVATDPAWQQADLRTRRVKQLGLVTCNKAILADLTAAMDDVARRGLATLIDTADFQLEGGCFNARVQRLARDARLSAHTWGIALDINVNVNPLGAEPHQDARLVAIMTAHNFTWGGRWLRPDGAHFEWVGPSVRH